MRGWFRSALEWISRETPGLLGKEAFKFVLLGFLAVVGAWLLAVFGELLQIDAKNLTWAALVQKLWADFLAYFAWDRAWRAVTDDPIRSFGALAIVSGFLILTDLWRRANRKFKASAVQRNLAEKAGLGGRWPHALTTGAGGAPWDDLRTEIARGDNHILYILGANGIDTFGGTASPLYRTMESFKGNVRVILADPDGKETAGRAMAVNTPVQQYRRAIRDSVQRLKELQRQQHPIDGRYYDGQPNWKFIITSRTAWVQYYAPGGKHVNETPVWRFDATPEGDGLYHLFQMEFERIWRRCGERKISL